MLSEQSIKSIFQGAAGGLIVLAISGVISAPKFFEERALDEIEENLDETPKRLLLTIQPVSGAKITPRLINSIYRNLRMHIEDDLLSKGLIIIEPDNALTEPDSEFTIYLTKLGKKLRLRFGGELKRLELNYAQIEQVTDETARTSTICNESYECGNLVGLPWELDGRQDIQAKLNAAKVCSISGSTYVSHNVVRHGIRCGRNYGLVNWRESIFVHTEEPICHTGSVTVINRIECKDSV